MQRGVGQVGDMSAHARHREPAPRVGVLDQITALAPFRVGHHGLAADFMERDVLCRVARRRRNRQRRKHTLRVACRPLQHLHATHRSAGHREQRLDAKLVEQHGLRAHHVANGDDRKIQAPRLAGLRIGRRGATGAETGADHVRANHEKPFGVDWLARTDHGLPPARLARDGIGARHMLIAGQRVADQYRVAALGVERAVGLVGDLEGRERDAGIKRQRFVGTEPRDQAIARIVGLADASRCLKRGANLGHGCPGGQKRPVYQGLRRDRRALMSTPSLRPAAHCPQPQAWPDNAALFRWRMFFGERCPLRRDMR